MYKKMKSILEITNEERLTLIKACEIIKKIDRITIGDTETEIPDGVVELLEDIDYALNTLVYNLDGKLIFYHLTTN